MNAEFDPSQFSAAGAAEAAGAAPGAPPKIHLMTYREHKTHYAASGGSFIIDRLIRPGTIVAICGRPGGGKTALAMEMARCLTCGEEFIGREVQLCSVAYIAVEDRADVSNRLEALSLDGVFLVVSEEDLLLTKPERAAAFVGEVIRQLKDGSPDLVPVVFIDTLRSALGGGSVLDDRVVSPALNALRSVAEKTSAAIGITNHTNREDPKLSKGETLESVAAVEIVLLHGDGGWHDIWLGKNRSGGAGYRKIARARLGSRDVNGAMAAIVEEIIPDDAAKSDDNDKPRGANQKLAMRIVRQLGAEETLSRPMGVDGPAVKVVAEKRAREEYMKLKSGEDAKNKGDTFKRAIDSLVEKNLLMRSENTAGEGILWLAKKADENAGHGYASHALDA